MARRQRVPRHKEHRRKRNKNPKLSPFQREQQRARLANQAPIASIKGSKRDYPVSQRAVMEYLMERREREEEKRRKRREAAEREAAADKAAEEVAHTKTASSSSSSASLPVDSSLRKDTKQKREKKKSGVLVKSKVKDKVKVKDTKKSEAPKVQSLNDEFSATLSKPVIFFRTNSENTGTDSVVKSSTEEIIARKKEKKHRKKVEARRVRVQEQLRVAEEELDNMISSQGKKKRRRGDPADAQNAAFEKKLKQMQKEKAAEAGAAAPPTLKKKLKKKDKQALETNSGDHITTAAENEDSSARDRKKITFTESTGPVDESHHVMRFPNDRSGAKRPRDFHELVDVVRFGDRVEAPPVFDAVPRHDASITRLATRLESSSRPGRHQLLSSVGGLGEKKRLERLGLAAKADAPAGHTTQSKMTKEEEMERLRERVMESYRRNRRVDVEGRKGVDMRHTFPVFS